MPFCATDGVDTLTPNKILNTFLPTESSVPLMSTMNRYLQSKGKHSTDHQEFGPLVRIINGLCYYTCSIVDVENHPNSHPIVTANVMSLRGNTFKKKIKRLNLLLRSFDGSKAKRQKTNDDDEALHFSAVYERDRELDKVFWDFGGHASRIAFIKGWSHLLIDDDKTRLRSKKVSCCLMKNYAVLIYRTLMQYFR